MRLPTSSGMVGKRSKLVLKLDRGGHLGGVAKMDRNKPRQREGSYCDVLCLRASAGGARTVLDLGILMAGVLAWVFCKQRRATFFGRYIQLSYNSILTRRNLQVPIRTR